MDQEAIKKALDAFENDKFSDAKDILTKEIQTRRDEFLADKLGVTIDGDAGDAGENEDV